LAKSVSHQVVQAFRIWVKSVIALTDEQIIPADAPGDRPPLPYLTVKALVTDIQVGTDFLHSGVDGEDNPFYQADGIRRATLSIRGYGKLSQTWLENLKLLASIPRSLDILDQVGLSLVPLGGIQDLTEVLDTTQEGVYLQEFDAYYRVQSEQLGTDEATQFQVDISLTGQTPPDQVVPGNIGDVDVGFGPNNLLLRRFNRPLSGAQDSVNQIFLVSEKFIHNGLNDEVVVFGGQRLREGEDHDYVAEESGGVGTGYDQIRFLLDWVPLPDDNIVIDYYADPSFA
jgi:hypothetical protein